jgi:alpha-D-ribose 1-methylphosphonate 5-triphosphate synthase subunit PhnH
MGAASLQAGFDDPVREAQAVFRSVMMALARPGTVQPLVTALRPPAPLTPELAAVALTLADHETTLWLDAPLAGSLAVADFLRFQTGARLVADAAAATFALVSDVFAMLRLASFAQGTDEYPDRSTTIVVAVERIQTGAGLRLSGPGIKGSASLTVSPLPREFVSQRAANHALFPRGVDCVFVASGAVAALPRSTAMSEA